MRMFDVQSIGIRAPREKVFEFLRHAGDLPQWPHAFRSAMMVGPRYLQFRPARATGRARADRERVRGATRDAADPAGIIPGARAEDRWTEVRGKDDAVIVTVPPDIQRGLFT